MERRPEPPACGDPLPGRDALAALAPGAASDLLDGVVELLDPLWPLLEPAAEDLGEPALAFDPVLAAGSPTTGFELPPPPPARPPDPPPDRELPWLTVCDLADLVRGGQVSAAEVVRALARRIDALDPGLNAFITPTVELALGQAGERPTGRLAGVPIGAKDLIDTGGVRTTCGSAIHADRVPERDAVCWQRLRTEGALLIGKLNTHEFAAGATSENDHFGAVRNPWDRTRIAGGSSGGSAAAVAAALTTASIGTDTGGSIRIPASCCGTVGLKPTFGAVATGGVQPLAWSLDHVGPLTRTVRDAALLLDVLAGTSCELAARAGGEARLAGLRVGVPARWLDDADSDIRSAFARAADTLAGCGARLVELPELPPLDRATAVNRVIAYAEASSAHDRLLRRHATGYGPQVRARQEAGRFVLATQYLAAQRLRAGFCRALAECWRRVDVLACPTLACAVPPSGARSVPVAGRQEPIGSTLVRLTGQFNLTGTPAITVPSGRDRNGLPTGLQIAGPPHAEPLVCFAAAAFEAAGGGPARPALAVG